MVIGVPKRKRVESRPNDAVDKLESCANVADRYRTLIERKIETKAEAKEILEIGIQQEGTRTEALKILATRLIWFEHYSAENAAQFLIDWALDPRHKSKEIQKDLANGSQVVAKQIGHMCRWYEKNFDSTNKNKCSDDMPVFSLAELNELKLSLNKLTGKEREGQAHFYLSFLRFAKWYGKVAEDKTGWTAAVSAGKVMRRWRGCSHCKYLKRLEHAYDHKTLKLVKEKWQRKGGDGRARTYQIMVPVSEPEQWTLDYHTALEILCTQAPIGQTKEMDDNHNSKVMTSQIEQRSESNERQKEPIRRERVHTADLRSSCSGANLDSSPRKCVEEPDEPTGVSDSDHEDRGSVFSRRHEQSGPTGGWDQHDRIKRQARIRTTVQDLPIHPRIKYTLLRRASELSAEDQKVRERYIEELNLVHLYQEPKSDLDMVTTPVCDSHQT